MPEQTAVTTTSPLPQQKLWQSFLLSVIPGLLVTAGFILFKRLLDASGYPPLLAFLLAILLIDLPLLLGVMLVEGKRLNGRYSLEGVVLYRDKVSWQRFLLVFIGAFVIVYLPISLHVFANAFVRLLFLIAALSM
jgi:hypothetical protein